MPTAWHCGPEGPKRHFQTEHIRRDSARMTHAAIVRETAMTIAEGRSICLIFFLMPGRAEVLQAPISCTAKRLGAF